MRTPGQAGTLGAMAAPLPPGRVSLHDVQAALIAEAQRTGDPYWLSFDAGYLRVIKHRHLTRGPGYDVLELVTWLDAHRPQPAEVDHGLTSV